MHPRSPKVRSAVFVTEHRVRTGEGVRVPPCPRLARRGWVLRGRAWHPAEDVPLTSSAASVKNPLPKGKSVRWWIFVSLAALGLLFGGVVALAIALGLGPPPEISYSEFAEAARSGEVQTVVFEDARISGDMVEGRDPARFRVTLPTPADPALPDRLVEQGVAVEATYTGPTQWDRLIEVMPLLLLLGIAAAVITVLARHGQLPGVGGGYAPKDLEERPEVRFGDIAGAAEAKEALQDVVSFLQDPARLLRLGGRMPKGVLLSGEPGTGKTLLARAVAGEANASFFPVSGSDFVEMFVGRGAARVRELFRQARERAPAIVFIDEIDAVARRRSERVVQGNEEREQTLNQILVEMDGFDEARGLVVIAATNREDVLDPALLRPGRFDRRVRVGRPNLLEREAILGIHVKKVPLAPTLDLRQVARGTSGMSGADLSNLVNEAALEAAKEGGDVVGERHFDRARDRILMGAPRDSCVLTEEQRRLTAYHEAGHALVPFFVSGLDPVHKVTIVPRGRALGVTASLPERDRYGYSARELKAQITMLMAGRAAEALILGPEDITTGAGNDIERATKIAEEMVATYGMSNEVGLVQVEVRGHGRRVSEATRNLVDTEIQRLIREGYERAQALLVRERRLLDEVATRLLEIETLDRGELARIVGPL